MENTREHPTRDNALNGSGIMCSELFKGANCEAVNRQWSLGWRKKERKKRGFFAYSSNAVAPLIICKQGCAYTISPGPDNGERVSGSPEQWIWISKGNVGVASVCEIRTFRCLVTQKCILRLRPQVTCLLFTKLICFLFCFVLCYGNGN